MLGTVTGGGVKSWSNELQDQMREYRAIKASSLPDFNRVQFDPLAGTPHEDWQIHYKVYYSILYYIIFGIRYDTV